MNIKHMVIIVLLLVGSDLLIGAYGHFKGTGESNFFEYITAQETRDELFVVFIFAIIIVAILHFVLKVG